MLKEKNSPPRRVKQLFFLRILQTFDARLRNKGQFKLKKQERNKITIKL